MDSPLQSHYSIRCPSCLHEMRVSKTISFSEEIRCAECDRRFEFRDALPPLRQHTGPPETMTENADNHTGINVYLFLFGIPAAILFILWSCEYHQQLSGLAFIFFILAVFLVSFTGTFLLRIHWYDNRFFSILAFLIFESISIHRLIWGFSHGMRNFGMLLLIMIICGRAYFIDVKNFFNNFSKKDRHAGGCGGGCGWGCGGGCGGGCCGCGGCGG